MTFLIPKSIKNNKLFYTMFDSFPLGVLIINTGGIIIYCNETQSKIDDMEIDFIVGKPELDSYGPYMGPGILKTCLDTGKAILGYVCHYRTVKGKIVNAAYWVYPISENNNVVASICFTQVLVDKYPILNLDNSDELAKNNNGKHINTVDDKHIPKKIIGSNADFRKALSIAQTTANSPSPILIAGETGCGKEVFTKAIREVSNRKNKPYQAINCSAIPSTLLEGVLFGNIKGSFTGAVDRSGLFEEASGGIIYLDEIDSMPLDMQAKLLRVLQEMRVRRLGSSVERSIDVKVISSISDCPRKILASGKLRPDLFYRLAVISVTIPPLRQRMDDLDELINYFIEKYNKLLNKNISSIDNELYKLFCDYHWPGNVRELEYIIAAAINLAAWEKKMYLYHVPEHHRISLTENKNFTDYGEGNENNVISQNYSIKNVDNSSVLMNGGMNLKEKEIAFIQQALNKTNGHITNAAKKLGISRQLLSYKIKKYSINRNKFKNMAI